MYRCLYNVGWLTAAQLRHDERLGPRKASLIENTFCQGRYGANIQYLNNGRGVSKASITALCYDAAIFGHHASSAA